MMKILLVRHAESLGNATGDYSTASHDKLSPRGRGQAATLAKRLIRGAHRFDHIITSPLRRAIETVTPYLEATGRQAEIWPEAAEACWQEREEGAPAPWRGEPAELPAHAHGLFSFRDGRAVRPREAETFLEGLGRVHAALDLLVERHGGPDSFVLMVTHGFFIREMLNAALRPSRLVAFPHGNCSTTMLGYSGTWTVYHVNAPPDRSGHAEQ